MTNKTCPKVKIYCNVSDKRGNYWKHNLAFLTNIAKSIANIIVTTSLSAFITVSKFVLNSANKVAIITGCKLDDKFTIITAFTLANNYTFFNF